MDEVRENSSTKDRVESFEYVTSVGFSSASRTLVQDYTPGTIATDTMGRLIYRSELTTATTTVPNSSSVEANITLSVVDNRFVIANPDIAVYIGISSTSDIATDGSNQWPTTTVGGGNFPVYINSHDWGKTNNNNAAAQVVMRNNVGSDQTILLVVRWRFIIQPVGYDGDTGTVATS